MDIKSLKDKILQLAIQGKLIPQNENDESVSVLLEKIKLEKEKLIKDKVIKKEKQLSKISEEERIFDLPNGWEWCRISDIIKVISGKSFNSKDFFDDRNGNKSIKITNVGVKKFIQTEGDLLPVEFKSKYEDFIVKKDDIIMALTRPFIKNGLKICRCPVEYDGALLNQRVAMLKDIYTDKKIQEYLFLYLSSSFVLEYIKENCNISLQPNLSINTLMEMIVPLPPLKEQERIVNKVEELFKLIDELDSDKQDLLENIINSKNKVLQLAIRGKLVEQGEDDEPANVLLENIKQEKEQLIKEKVIKKEKSLPEITEEEKLFDIPKTWEWSRLGNIANIVMGQSPDSSSVSGTIGGVEFHQGKASFGKVLIKSSGLYCTKPKKLAVSDDVLLSVRAPVGTLNITDREICIGRGLTAIRRYVDIDNKFFYYFIMALEEELVKKATGTTFKAVASTAIKEFLVPLPPLEEQKRIVAKVDLIMDYLDKLQQEIESNEIILEDIIK